MKITDLQRRTDVTDDEKIELARKMGHSINMQNLYKRLPHNV